jgi:hypothetical protein
VNNRSTQRGVKFPLNSGHFAPTPSGESILLIGQQFMSPSLQNLLLVHIEDFMKTLTPTGNKTRSTNCVRMYVVECMGCVHWKASGIHTIW